MKEERMKVLMVEPGKKPYAKEIGNDLEDLQRAVGGLIEVYRPYEDCLFVVNEEGKICGLRPNRTVYDEKGQRLDILFGPFFICDSSGEDFASLPEDLIKKYSEVFSLPEWFLREGNDIVSVKFDPDDPKVKGERP